MGTSLMIADVRGSSQRRIVPLLTGCPEMYKKARNLCLITQPFIPQNKGMVRIPIEIVKLY